MFLKLISDIISYAISLIVSLIFNESQSSIIINIDQLIFFLLGMLYFILCIYNYNGYKSRTQFSRLSEITSLVNSAIFLLLTFVVLEFVFNLDNFLLNSDFLSKFLFCILIIILPSILRIILQNMFPNSIQKDNVVLIGLGEIGKSFLDTHIAANTGRFNFVAILDDTIKKNNKDLKYQINGKISELDNYVTNNRVDRIIVAVRKLSDNKINYINNVSIDNKIILNFIPSIESFKNDIGKLKEHSGIPLITREYSNQSFFYKFVKRFFDIILALIGFIISLPIFIIISILIIKDSKGPIIFNQRRIGLNGKPFKLFKFRSMYIDTPKYAHCPISASDPRITKIGKWLRKTSLDELPQIINILKGDMSLVGPRPEMPFIVEKYNSIEKNRLLVKPGLTGLWQVSPHRNAEINHNLEYDFYYIENQNLVLDLVIIIMTAVFAVRGITH